MPARAKGRGRIMVCVIELGCPRCGKRFRICRSCYRKHVYCGKECSRASRREGKQVWQHEHRQTDAGRDDHRDQERERRRRRRDERAARVGRHTSPAGEQCCNMTPDSAPTRRDAGCSAPDAERQGANEDAHRAVPDETQQALGDHGSVEASHQHRCAFCGRAGYLVACFGRRPTGRAHGVRDSKPEG